MDKTTSMLPRDLAFSLVASPIGELLIAGTRDALYLIRFPTARRMRKIGADWRRDDAALKPATDQLTAYFAGELREFDLPIKLIGSDFEREVWRLLRQIPYGETTSYGAIARQLGQPTASRAVGAANGANPIPIIVPCHRVIGADGSLTGFGGGLDTKEYLLDLEQARGYQARLI